MSALPTLRRLLSRGRGVTVAVHGPAGVGKSYAVDAFLRTLPCRAFRVSADAPAQAVFAAVPPASREPEWVEAVARRLARREGVRPQDAAAALAARLGLHAPAVVVADHLHRADADQQAFWQALGSAVHAGKSLGLVVLTRGEPPPGWLPHPVLPLDREAEEALVRDVLQAPPPRQLLDWLREQAHGHPLYILELLAHLQRTGAVQRREGHLRWQPPERATLPPTLEALIRALLPPNLGRETQRELVRVLLMAGPCGELPALAGTGPTHELEGLGLLREGRLSHPLYRDALLPWLPADLVSETLEEIAAVSGGLGDPLAAARLLPSLPVSPGVAARLLEGAARHAEELGDYRRAAELWQELAGTLPPRERWRALWTASWLLGDALSQIRPPLELALEALRLRRDLTPEDPPTLEDWRWTLRLLLFEGGSLETLLDLGAGPWRAELTAQARLEEIAAAGWGQRSEEVVGLWEALPDEVRQAAPDNVRTTHGLALFRLGRLEEAGATLGQVIREAPPGRERVRARLNLGLIPLYQGDFAQARRVFEQVITEAAALGKPQDRDYLTRIAQNNLAMVLMRCGEPQAALALFRQLAQDHLDRGDLPDYAGALCRVADGLIATGDFAGAQDALLEAHELRAQQRPAAQTHAPMHLVLLYFCWQHEASATLLAHFTAELERRVRDAPAQPYIQEKFVLALGLVACGQPELAAPLIEEADEASRSAGVTQGLSYAHWVRGVRLAELGDRAGAVQAAREAARLAREAGDVLEADKCALWAALYAGDDTELERLSAHLGGLGYHGEVHAVQVRRVRPPLAVQAGVQIQVLGDVRVYGPSGERYVSRPGTALLVALLCARLQGEDGVGVETLAEELYPDRAPGVAVRNLHRLVRGLQAQLGATTVVRSGERYVLGDVISDAETFLSTHDDGLWRGPFLGGDADSGPQGAVHQLLLTRLEARTRLYLETDPAQAVRLADLLHRTEPYERGHLATLLRAHDAAGQPRRAGAVYRRARPQFAEVGETLPARWQDFLAGGGFAPGAPGGLALAAGPAEGTVSAAYQARALQVHRSTVRRWQTGQTRRPGQRGRPARLSSEAVEELRRTVRASPEGARAWTLSEVADYVEARYGVRYSAAQLSRLLRPPGGAE